MSFNNNCPVAAGTPLDPNISWNMARLANEILACAELVDLLEARLEPVMRPSHPIPDETVSSHNSGLGCKIAGHRDAIHALNLRLERIANRLDLENQ